MAYRTSIGISETGTPCGLFERPLLLTFHLFDIRQVQKVFGSYFYSNFDFSMTGLAKPLLSQLHFLKLFGEIGFAVESLNTKFLILVCRNSQNHSMIGWNEILLPPIWKIELFTFPTNLPTPIFRHRKPDTRIRDLLLDVLEMSFFSNFGDSKV